MKFLMLASITLQLLALEAHAQTPTREDLRKTVIHQAEIGRELAAEVTASNAQLASAQKQIAALRIVVASATQQIEIANGRVVTLNAAIEKMTAWGVAQQARAEVAEKDLRATLERYHRLKIIAALLVAALSTLAALQLGPLLSLAGPYGALLPVAAGAAGFAVIWFLL